MKLKAKQQAFRIALSYGVAAGSWVLLSDGLMTRWFQDAQEQTYVALAKDWGFVLLTTALLFFLLHRLLHRWEREIEQRQDMETSLRRGERAQRIVSECTQAILRATTEPALLEEICRVIVQAGGYRMAWVGFRENDAAKSIRFAAHAGDTGNYLAEARIGWDESSERGRGPAGITLSTGQITLTRDFQTDPNLGPWREAAARCGYASSIVLPLRHLGRTFGALSLYAGDVNAFSPTEVELLTELADDLAHGIQALRNQLAKEQAEAAAGESDLLLRSIMEHSNEIIFVKDRECRFVYMNPAGYRLSGLTPEKLLGRSKADFHPDPDEVARFMADDRRVMESGQMETLEEALRGADGLPHVFLTTKVPRRDSQGQVIGLIGIAHDITQRKQAELQLRASEEKFSRMFHSSPVSMTLSRLENGCYLDVNTAFLKVLERSREEVIGQSALDLGVWANAEQRARVVAQLQAAGTVRDVILETRGKSGRIRHLLWSVEQVVIGDHAYLLGSGQDITQHRLVEQNLRESQALYHSLVAQLPIGIFRKDPDGRFVLVNPAFCQLKSMAPEDFLGKTPLEAAQANQIGGVLLRQTGKYASAGEDHHRRIMETGEAIELMEEYALPDGTLQFVHVMKFPVRDAAGHIVGSQGVLFDITARKRAEDQLNLQSSALTAAANAIVITDARGRIEWVNPAFTELTGYGSAEVLGAKLSMLKSHHHPPAFYSAMWNTILAGNVWHGEVVNQRKDGTRYTEEMTITPVRVAGGKIAHFVAIKQDVSERRQLENRLQQAQKMEAIGTLAGGIAHDFNNILAAILGFSYLLQQDTEENPAAQEEIREIIKASCRAKDLVQQILTFSRKREQERQVIRLDTVVKEAARFLRASLPTQIEIETELDAAAPAVLADPTQIYQMTVNLGTNALHAMEGRPGQLSIRLEAFLPDAKFIQSRPEFRAVTYARLTVADTGHGMDEKTVARIFEPFFTTKPAGKGTGLGLAVVHGLVQAHEGVITVDSQPGHGATFCIYLPGKAENTALVPAPTAKLPFGQGQNILLVDDEKALTLTMERLLRRLNYQVTSRNSAREALALFHQNGTHFDLVITDFTMPEINGLELARQLHALHRDLPIVLASGLPANLSREDLAALGICDLLQKPIDMATLANLLHQILTRPR